MPRIYKSASSSIALPSFRGLLQQGKGQIVILYANFHRLIGMTGFLHGGDVTLAGCGGQERTSLGLLLGWVDKACPPSVAGLSVETQLASMRILKARLMRRIRVRRMKHSPWNGKAFFASHACPYAQGSKLQDSFPSELVCRLRVRHGIVSIRAVCPRPFWSFQEQVPTAFDGKVVSDVICHARMPDAVKVVQAGRRL